MKLTSTPVLSLLAIAAFVMCTSFRPLPSTVVATVTFGTPQQYSSTCVGRGICGNVPGVTTGGTHVGFQLLEGNPDVLVLTFSLSDLKNNQPEQVSNFTSGTYAFEGDYALSGDTFDALNLPANSAILTTSPTQVAIDGDAVTVYIVYAHD